MGRNSNREEEFGHIWQRFYAPLVIFCRAYTADGSMEAEDLAQEVLLKVYSHLDSYNPRFALATWVYRIARNHCIDCLRIARRRNTVPFRPEASQWRKNDTEGNPCSTPAELNTATCEKGPEEHVEREEIGRWIKKCLEGLTREDRHIAFLRFYEELRYKEIAKAMDMPIGTVKYRVFRIKARLKQHLEGNGYV